MRWIDPLVALAIVVSGCVTTPGVDAFSETPDATTSLDASSDDAAAFPHIDAALALVDADMDAPDPLDSTETMDTTAMRDAHAPADAADALAPDARSASDARSSCVTSTDCRSGEACKGFREGRFCAEAGTRSSGSTCSTHLDCRDEAVCQDWMGGYCAEAGCTTNADCASGTWCVAIDGANVCLVACVSEPCREAEGYACALRATEGGIDRFVCIP
jgi:hypothetical protein